MNKFVFPMVSGLGAAIAIGILAGAQSFQPEWLFLMAPFGATTVLVFGVPDSPLAQPKNVIAGHVLTAFIGVCFVEFIGVTPLSLAAATGVGVTAMLMTKTTHPPAGANPILIMLAGQSWGFLFTPVLLGAVVIVLVGKAMQKVRIRYS